MPTPTAMLDIDMPNLAEMIGAMTEGQINELPFGAVRLDADGKVVFYSDGQRRVSGLRKEAVSRLFFTEIAPCLNTPRYRGRIDKAFASGQFDLTFNEVTDLPSGEKDVELHVRMLATKGGDCWILMKPEQ